MCCRYAPIVICSRAAIVLVALIVVLVASGSVMTEYAVPADRAPCSVGLGRGDGAAGNRAEMRPDLDFIVGLVEIADGDHRHHVRAIPIRVELLQPVVIDVRMISGLPIGSRSA